MLVLRPKLSKWPAMLWVANLLLSLTAMEPTVGTSRLTLQPASWAQPEEFAIPTRQATVDEPLPQWKGLLRKQDFFIAMPMVMFGAIAARSDIQTYHAVRSLPDPELYGQPLSFYGSFLGEGYIDVMIVLAFGLFDTAHGVRVCLAGLQALVATAIVSRVGKMIFRLERPSYDGHRQHYFSQAQADAMPSGHAMAAFATAAVLASEYPRWSPLFYVLASYVGLARIQQSTHWLSDVVIGGAIGVLLGWYSYRWTQWLEIEVGPVLGVGMTGIQIGKRL